MTTSRFGNFARGIHHSGTEGSNPLPSSGESTNHRFLPDFIPLLPRSTSYSPPTIKVHSPSGYVTPQSFFANVRLLTLHRDAAHYSLELSKEYDEWIGA